MREEESLIHRVARRVKSGYILSTVLALALAAAVVSSPSPADRGPALGQPLPALEAVDQHGIRQTFSSLRGPKGLMLFFNQSADW
jgi:hypothetical protein